MTVTSVADLLAWSCSPDVDSFCHAHNILCPTQILCPTENVCENLQKHFLCPRDVSQPLETSSLAGEDWEEGAKQGGFQNVTKWIFTSRTASGDLILTVSGNRFVVLELTDGFFFSPGCPSSWLYNGSNCYLFSDTKEPLERAINECTNQSAGLLSIKSQDEQDFITRHLKVDLAW